MSEEMTEGADVEETAATPEATDAAPAAEPATWLEGIEDEKVKNLAGRYTTPAAMANALYEANRELSQRVKMPGEDASDEDRAKFNKQMGVPESVDDYEIAAPEGVDARRLPVKSIRHRSSRSSRTCTPRAPARAWSTRCYRSISSSRWPAQPKRNRLDVEHMQKAEADLRKEWGASYDENVAFANDYLSKSPDLVKLELRDGSLLGSHPQFVRQMAEVGRMANEGQLKFGISGTEMATDMKAQYDQLSRDIHTAYQSGDRSRAATLTAQRSAIAERLHGTQAIVGAGRSI